LSQSEDWGGLHEPTFAEPWQAQVFALTVKLNERGIFSWSEWSEALGKELIGAAQDGSDYYERWLLALDELLVRKNVATSAQIQELTAAWQRAAEAKPHGSPILLENDPLTGGLTLDRNSTGPATDE